VAASLASIAMARRLHLHGAPGPSRPS
jgi:hypothetical protein